MLKRAYLPILILACLGLASLLVTNAAQAHGPSRQKVIKTVDIQAPPAAVWAIIKDFGSIDKWHPAVAKVVWTGGNVVGATRVVTLKTGGEIKESLTKYDADSMTYAYEITDVNIDVYPVNTYSSQMSVKPNGSGGTTLEWRAAFYRGYTLNDPPEKYNDDAALAAVTGVVEAGVNNIKALAEKK
jgi:carbon monoxide dehydrogenase subunit G